MKNFLNWSICFNFLNVFIKLTFLLKLSNIKFNSSKIFSALRNDLIEFFLKREDKCLITLSSMRILTYDFFCRTIWYQFAFSFSLFLIIDSQSSIKEFFSSMNIEKSSNFFEMIIFFVDLSVSSLCIDFIDAFSLLLLVHFWLSSSLYYSLSSLSCSLL
jgi:hypothetical protein